MKAGTDNLEAYQLYLKGRISPVFPAEAPAFAELWSARAGGRTATFRGTPLLPKGRSHSLTPIGASPQKHSLCTWS